VLDGFGQAFTAVVLGELFGVLPAGAEESFLGGEQPGDSGLVGGPAGPVRPRSTPFPAVCTMRLP
jgi:hypothetical protein